MGSREPQRVHEQPCTEIKTQVEEARMAILPLPHSRERTAGIDVYEYERALRLLAPQLHNLGTMSHLYCSVALVMGSREPQRVHDQPCAEIKTQVGEAASGHPPPHSRERTVRAKNCRLLEGVVP